MTSSELRNVDIWKKKENKASSNDEMFLMADITELALTNRSINALRRAGCKTMRDIDNLLGENGEGLGTVRNIGTKSKKEIIEKFYSVRDEYRNSACSANQTGYFDARVMLTTGKKTWNREITHYLISGNSLEKFNEAGIRLVSDLYAPVVKDPGWRAVRELFEAIANGRVSEQK